jgi:hypothetical protein
VVLDFLVAVHFEPTLMALGWALVEPIQPIARDDADDVGEAPLAVATAFLHRNDGGAGYLAPALRLPERVLHRGPVHARPGRDGVDVKGAAPACPAFVADDAHHGDLAPCESGGQGRWQRAGRDEAPATLNRGLPVGRSLSPASPAPWGVSRAAGCSTGRLPTRLDGLPARPCGLVEGLHLVFVGSPGHAMAIRSAMSSASMLAPSTEPASSTSAGSEPRRW